MQRFTLNLEFPDLKPHQWTELRGRAEAFLREDSEGKTGLEDQVGRLGHGLLALPAHAGRPQCHGRAGRGEPGQGKFRLRGFHQNSGLSPGGPVRQSASANAP